MTYIEVHSVPLSSSGLVKMEERKRPASYDNDDSAPPQKRIATASVNGSSKSHQDADLPGKDDLERFQKEAIYRQMQEYKREKNTLESQLELLQKESAYHDDHLRLIDAWFTQLLDEIRISAGKMAKDADDGSYSTFPSTLLSTDNSTFEKHLKSRSSAISSAIQTIFSEDRRSEPSISELQERIARLLLAEKLNVNELETIRLDKELLRQRLETASMRYLKAERNIDRARSITVVKIERQAIASSGSAPATETAPNKNESANGQVDNAALVEAETATKEAAAASAKKAEQIEKLETENSKLIAELTAVRARLSHLTDDDYANTDLFKQIKLQHDDVVNRINGLEAVNTELRQENQKLQGERSAYRMQLDAESQAATSERDLQLSKVESDLTRIRTTRDELSSDLNIRKASQEQERASINQMKQFLSVKDDRINALEAQVKRLEADQPAELGSDIQDLSLDDVQGKYSDLERKYSMLKMELDSITSAYKKVSSTTSQKINNLSELEEKAARLSAEKAKADQKYFAAMKAKDARDQEIRALRAQNSKSSDIVSQLKDAEASTRALVANLEKNVCDTKELQTGLETKFRAVQKQVEDRDIKLDGLKKQVNELKNHLTTKDNAYTSMAGANRKLEVELEQMKVDAKEKGKQLEMYKTKGSGADGDTADMLRAIAICTVCRKNFKDTVVKTCGHVFCKECVEERLASRMRKCPNCNKPFGANDHMRITL